MRILILAAAACLLAGCGSSAGNSANPIPTATPFRQLSFSHPPKFTINVNDHYTATVRTSDGTFAIELLPKVAPVTVNNFVFLARHHFFDGVIFHRIIVNFMVQTGDPTGTGFGGPGYHFKDEKVTLPYTRGTVAMANSGANTNGSQFFIVTVPPGRRAQLPPAYTIFGHVSSGMDIVQRISETPVAPNSGSGEISSPVKKVSLEKVTIQRTA